MNSTFALTNDDGLAVQQGGAGRKEYAKPSTDSQQAPSTSLPTTTATPVGESTGDAKPTDPPAGSHGGSQEEDQISEQQPRSLPEARPGRELEVEEDTPAVTEETAEPAAGHLDSLAATPTKDDGIQRCD